MRFKVEQDLTKVLCDNQILKERLDVLGGASARAALPEVPPAVSVISIGDKVKLTGLSDSSLNGMGGYVTS